jgi:hypothetical protein
MKANIVSQITVKSHEASNNESVLNNEIVSSDSIANMAAGFKVIVTDKQTLVLDPTSGAALNETITVTNCSFVHVQCNKYVAKASDKPERRRFAISYNGSSVGNMSQFQVIDCDDVKALIISNIVVPTGEKVVLTIVKGRHT